MAKKRDWLRLVEEARASVAGLLSAMEESIESRELEDAVKKLDESIAIGQRPKRRVK